MTTKEEAWAAYIFSRDQLIRSRIADAQGITSGARSRLFEEATNVAVRAYGDACREQIQEIVGRGQE